MLYRKYIKTEFFINNMHCQELYLGNFKSDLDFFAPSDSRFSNSCISATYCVFRLYMFCLHMCSLGIKPTTFALLTQCSTTEPQEHLFPVTYFI